MPKTLVFGSSGQLGARLLANSGDLDSELIAVPRTVRLDDREAVVTLIESERPAWIVNAAALTDVDGAHMRPEDAMTVNAVAPGIMAQVAFELGVRVVHISSEAVFRGDRVEKYREEDPTDPVSVYGTSKLAGDQLVHAYSPDSYVLRTSWLYSDHQGSNFPTRIVNQLSDPSRTLSVVTDVVGNPTPTSVLVDAIAAVMRTSPPAGVYHVCCSGTASKYDWAVEIARSYGFDSSRITPVTSDAYPTVALRPKYVDLDCAKFIATGIMPLPTWQDAWARTASGLAQG